MWRGIHREGLRRCLGPDVGGWVYCAASLRADIIGRGQLHLGGMESAQFGEAHGDKFRLDDTGLELIVDRFSAGVNMLGKQGDPLVSLMDSPS